MNKKTDEVLYSDSEGSFYCTEGLTEKESTELEPKPLNRKNKKKYNVTTDEQRRKLVFLVMTQSYSILDAAKETSVGYSAALKRTEKRKGRRFI